MSAVDLMGAAPVPRRRGRSPAARALGRLLRHRLGVSGLAFVILMVLVATFARRIAPYDPNAADFLNVLQPPSTAHPFGTDNVGRDVLARVLFGAQISLQVVAFSISGAVVIGGVLGIISGYFSGWLDAVLMRLMDALLAFPMLILALAVVAILGPDLINAMVAIMIVNVPGFARLVRAQVLSIRRLEFVTAARCIGAGNLRILFRHIAPMLVGNVVVYGSLRASAAILTESSLSFLGLGVQPPTPSWGSMLTTAMQYWDAWWLSVFPGAAIFLAVLSLNFLGDGLRDALDVKLAE